MTVERTRSYKKKKKKKKKKKIDVSQFFAVEVVKIFFALGS
tara:strand:- start:139 stop:261 length:123 start_codon:yes stop_codon:yes gene_type:complete